MHDDLLIVGLTRPVTGSAPYDAARAAPRTTAPRECPHDRYRVEAAIAALHTVDGQPDRARIADLYGILARLAPSPVVEVNRAVAVGLADGPHAGLVIIEAALGTRQLDDYAPAQIAHAGLLEQTGDLVGARSAWARAARLSVNPARRASLDEHGRGLG